MCHCSVPATSMPAGAGESGKSTIFKQMKILYGTGFKDDDRKQQTPVIMQNIIGVRARRRKAAPPKLTATSVAAAPSLLPPPPCTQAPALPLAQQAKVLIQACEDLEIEVGASVRGVQHSVSRARPSATPQQSAPMQAERDAIDELSEEEPITPEIATQIKTFWEDAGVQEVYGRRSEFQLNDSAA